MTNAHGESSPDEQRSPSGLCEYLVNDHKMNGAKPTVDEQECEQRAHNEQCILNTRTDKSDLPGVSVEPAKVT